MNLTTGPRKPFEFSIFASLRPSHVIAVGAGVTRSVCVCIYHQNVKLMLSAIIDVVNERIFLWIKSFVPSPTRNV
ncbi:Cc8L18.2-like protein [Daphnia magna]|uniref:Cc8L18.2-like protein n=1 Tax=Daphnia magna TaxID=35525 RepID=A0A164PGH5_9CRUS|nr:Cc8L18.2-like protein [Daphnia magna]